MDSKVVQDIMDTLQDTTETLMEVAGKVAQQSEALSDHNSSAAAHPYILQLIANLDAITLTELNNAIQEHSNSTTAHGDLRTSIDTLNTTITTVLEHSVEDHNVSGTAHADIRGLITTLNNEMSTVRTYKQYIEMLDDLFGGVSGSIPALDALVSRVSVLESGLNSINSSVSNIDYRTSTLEASQIVQDTRIDTLETKVAKHTTDIGNLQIDLANTKLRLFTVEQKLQGELNLSTLVHTVPIAIKANTQYIVKFSGITVPVGNTLALALSSIPAGITFSKTTGIVQDENITMSVGAGVIPGTILSFKLDGTLSGGDVDSVSISTRVTSLPDMRSLVVSGIDNPVAPSIAKNYAFTAATDPDGGVLTYSIAPGSMVGCTVTIDSATKKGVFTATGVAGSNASFTIRATNVSGYSDKTFTTVIAAQINISNLIASALPSFVKPNGIYSISFSGATSTNGAITYTVIPKSGSVITFTAGSNMGAGQICNMSIPSNAPRGSVQTMVVTATDAAGVTATKEFTTTVNRLPVITNMVTTLAAAVNGGTTTPFSISGANDTDVGQTLSYGIQNVSSSKVSFSKTSGITAGESINMIAGKVPTTTTVTFDVIVTDSIGESSVIKTFSVTINVVWVANTPSILSPTEGQVMSTDTMTFTFSEIDVVASA